MKNYLSLLCMLFMLSVGASKAQVANYEVVPLPKSVNLVSATGFLLTESAAVVFPEGNTDMERNARFLCDYVNEMTKMRLSTQAMPAKAKAAKVGERNILLVLDEKIQNDEGYTISVTAQGNDQLAVGIRHALHAGKAAGIAVGVDAVFNGHAQVVARDAGKDAGSYPASCQYR